MSKEFGLEDLINLIGIVYRETGELKNLYAFDNEPEFFNMVFEGEAFEAVRATQLGSYNMSDAWVSFNEQNNLISFTTPEYTEMLTNYAEDVLTVASKYVGEIDEITIMFEEIGVVPKGI